MNLSGRPLIERACESKSRHSLASFVHLDAIIIDGRSGSGKTSLAARLTREMRAAGRSPQLLRVEDLYPGWDGLAAGSFALAEVLRSGRYRRYDWYREEFAEEQHIDARMPLIIEGCGAITAANLVAFAEWADRAVPRHASESPRTLSLWIDCPTEERRARALARDGETYAPHWERWAAQEDAHYGEHRPWLLADKVLA